MPPLAASASFIVRPDTVKDWELHRTADSMAVAEGEGSLTSRVASEFICISRVSHGQATVATARPDAQVLKRDSGLRSKASPSVSRPWAGEGGAERWTAEAAVGRICARARRSASTWRPQSTSLTRCSPIWRIALPTAPYPPRAARRPPSSVDPFRGRPYPRPQAWPSVHSPTPP